jgi:hypothetical protein
MYAPIAQLDRASDYGSEGWGFESSWAYHMSASGLMSRRRSHVRAGSHRTGRPPQLRSDTVVGLRSRPAGARPATATNPSAGFHGTPRQRIVTAVSGSQTVALHNGMNFARVQRGRLDSQAAPA